MIGISMGILKLQLLKHKKAISKSKSFLLGSNELSQRYQNLTSNKIGGLIKHLYIIHTGRSRKYNQRLSKMLNKIKIGCDRSTDYRYQVRFRTKLNFLYRV